MPIKLPRGFARRKSHGNALDDLGPASTPVKPSFKVFERPSLGPVRKSYDGTTTLNSSISDGSGTKHSLEDHYATNIFAGLNPSAPGAENRYVHPTDPAPFYPGERGAAAGGGQVAELTSPSGSRATNNSASTGPFYDSSASSAKFSSSSTLPSSTDIPIQDVPVPPIHESSFFSLRSAGRTFSFGTKSSKAHRPDAAAIVNAPRSRVLPSTATSTSTRECATTNSATNATTPPRLPDTDLGPDDSMSFENMFEGLDKEAAGPLAPSPQSQNPAPPYGFPPPPVPTKDLSSAHIYRSREIELSPHTNESQNLQDSVMGRTHSREDDAVVARPLAVRTRTSGVADTKGSLSPTHNALSSPRKHRNTVYLERTASVEDEDAKIVNSAVSHRRTQTSDISPVGEHSDFSGSGWQQRSSLRETTDYDDDDSPVAASIAEEVILAERYEQKASHSDNQPNKVMTPAQFERYRQQKEMTRKKTDTSSSYLSDDDSDHYDDEEDEVEKAREAAKQRKRQEAHLSVYRQQMMKVTGEQAKPQDSDLNISIAGSLSNLSRTSFLAPETSTNGNSTGNGKSSDGEEDEDIPLGILAAHGFPNKVRPPGHLTPSISNPNLRSSMASFVQPPPSVSGEAIPQASRVSLPVFARNLPRDPYNIGAGLINPSHRESLALGGGSPSVYGAPPGLPPGGLVGVIASEERAKAMRRGSPNGATTPNSFLGTNGPQGNWSNMMGMNTPSPHFLNVPGGGGSPMGLGPQQMYSQQPQPQQYYGQAQMMTQMMQTQIQWMQSMMQMQGLPTQPMPGAGPGQQMTAPGSPIRPVSMLSMGPGPNVNQGPPQVDHQTLSLLDPRWTNRQSSFLPNSPYQTDFNMSIGPLPGTATAYAPSVAPSERSNVGTASRYRPVSTGSGIQVGGNERTMSERSSTFTSSTLKPWNEGKRGMSFSSGTGVAAARPLSHLRVETPVGDGLNGNGKGNENENGNAEDDDEDEGWAEMMKTREKKKSGWKYKKTASSLGELFHHHHHHHHHNTTAA
ncbi:hypothetical protein GX48_04752 [Paracoccidioides brasiliensis]|nr:hypothetical protein GX48_04752 [Paracoccidioides brasiliensis]